MQREADRGFVRVSAPKPRPRRRRLARLNLALIAGLLLSLLSLNATQSFVARNSAAADDGHVHTHDHGGKLQVPSRVNRDDSPYALQKPSPSRNADLMTAAGEPMVTSLAAAATPETAGQWSPLMDWPLVAVHTALLPNGNVLMWEAWELPDTPSVRVWNPTTQQFVSTPHPTSAIFCAGQAMLADGRQFVAGGMLDNSKGIKHSSIFDPATNKWTRKANMAYARWYPTTVTLGDGRVLVLGGQITPGVYAQIPEIYNPATNVWAPLNNAKLNVGEYQELNAFVLPNGKVLINAAKDGITRTLDPNTQTWTAYGRSPAPDGTAAMFRPGKLLVTGGGGLERNGTGPTVNTSAVLDMTQPAPAWRTTAPMASVRDQHNLVLLPDGKVFAVGGSTTDIFTGALAAEIWDPATETWTTMASMAQPRMYHSTALLLPDGRVLIAGGGREGSAPDYLTAQIYSPPYLSKGPRPTIASAPAAATYGSSMTVGTPDAANIASAAFVRLGSNTHTVNFDQRYIPLDFTQTAGGLTVQSPLDANTAPPGYYMLFIIDGNGVPSVSKMVQLGGTSTTPTPTPTPTSTSTPTPTPTATPTGGTATPTNTPVPPTNTPIPPTPTSTPTAGAGLVVYDNAIRNGFSDGSYNYSALNWCDGTTNTSTPCGIGITFQGYGTLSFRHAGANTSSYSRFEFDFNPQGRPITSFGALLVTSTGAVTEVGLASNHVTALANGWVRVSIPLAELNPSNGLVVEVDISNYASTSIPTVYFDEIKFR